jgi:uncharacterized protein DUF4384
MDTPEWMPIEQGLRGRRIARFSIATILVALGALAGIGIGIPIGRDQQAQRPYDARQWPEEPRRGIEASRSWLSAEDGSGDPAARPLPGVPHIATLPTDLQQAFKRFHCGQAEDATWAQCAALAVLQADSRFEPGSTAAPKLLSGSIDDTYQEGQRIALVAKASSEFDGYLYVDYFDREGNVVHLRPGRYSEGRSLKADAWVDLGGRDYVACRPFGTDLVIAISTPLPIFESERPRVERAAGYLRVLHTRLQEMAGVNEHMRPASDYTAVVTVPRESTGL